MGIQVLFVFVLTITVTFLVVITSVTLVIHKMVNARTLRKEKQLYSKYASVFAELLLNSIPELPPGSKTSAKFNQYEELLRGTNEELERLTARARKAHRKALRLVLIDFAGDITGEPADRLVYFFYSFGFVEEQIRLMKDRRWWIRAQSARDVGLLKARKAITSLTACLEDKNADVRMESTQSLAGLAGVEALRTIFRLERNLSRWAAIQLSVIVMRYREAAVPYLLEGLEADDATIVEFCIEMLADIGFTEGVEPLRRIAVEFPQVHVRAKAIEALGRLNDQRAEELLIGMLESPFPVLRQKAADALGRIGTPRAVPVLSAQLHRGDVEERLTIARALAFCGTTGLAVLLREQEKNEALSRQVARQALNEMQSLDRTEGSIHG